MTSSPDLAPWSTDLTEAASKFIENASFSDLSEEALRVGKRCVLDGLALIVAGSNEKSVRILVEEALETDNCEEALLFEKNSKVSAPKAARILGTSGHAHDWDDSQVSRDPNHVYGLLTHPTVPVLTAALVTAQKINKNGGKKGNNFIDGKQFILAFLIGFEIECKVSEYMSPAHYRRGMHSSGTVGTLGAFCSAAKLLNLRGAKLKSGLGIAASMASGIRCNFGTMTKPLHVGRAAENGVTAALLAQKGFEADQSALDGQWGFMAVQGHGVFEKKLAAGFGGNKWSIVEPGVSIKPYPCGVLTHPTIDLMLKLVTEHDIQGDDIQSVVVHAGSNILRPIRYKVAANHLEAKFCLPAALAMIALVRRAGKKEFSDEFVGSAGMQRMQRVIETRLDEDIEKMGFDKMRSRIVIQLKKNNEIVEGWANENYRGGPDNPMSDQELLEKVEQCCEDLLDEQGVDQLVQGVKDLIELEDAAVLAKLICTK